MSISQALCNSYKVEILQGLHQADHEYKLALYNEYAKLDKHSEFYTNTDEISGKGYTEGGVILKGFKVILDGDTAIVDFDDVEINDCSIITKGALIYNNSLSNKNSVAVIDFKKSYRSKDGKCKITFPDPIQNRGLIKII